MKRLIGAIWTAFVLITVSACSKPSNDGLEAKASKIHKKILTLDTHVDTPMRVFRKPADLSVRHARSEKNAGDLDFPRMIEGGLDGAFFAVYVGQGECTDEGRAKARATADKIIDLILGWKTLYPKWVEVAYSPEDAERIHKTGKRIAYIGMENGYPLGTDPSLLRHFYARGVRYVTLCHVRNNDICDSSTDPDGPKWNGLSPFGEKVVAEMNRLGMLIDLSHVSDSTFYQVIRRTKTPVFASHSCCRALMDSPRNLTDDMLRALAGKNGVVQINLCSFYLIPSRPDPRRSAAMDSLKKIYGEWTKIEDPEKLDVYEKARDEINIRFPQKKASVKDMADHVDHAVKIAGIDHVGIGSDFDGGAGLSDCADVSQVENITLELARRGYNERDIAKIWSGNFLRFWRDVRKSANL